jgi:hypothetical protein
MDLKLTISSVLLLTLYPILEQWKELAPGERVKFEAIAKDLKANHEIEKADSSDNHIAKSAKTSKENGMSASPVKSDESLEVEGTENKTAGSKAKEQHYQNRSGDKDVLAEPSESSRESPRRQKSPKKKRKASDHASDDDDNEEGERKRKPGRPKGSKGKPKEHMS